jgi:hypothetical protein
MIPCFVSALVRLLNMPAFIMIALVVCLVSSPVLASEFADRTDKLSVAVEVGSPPDSTIGKEPYAFAWEAAQECGKLCVYIGSANCRHCPAALAEFTKNEPSTNAACVKLDADKDKKYMADIAEEVLQADGSPAYPVPQVIVYTRTDGVWQRQAVIGAKLTEIALVMLGGCAKESGSGLASVPAEKLHQVDHCVNCKNCPADCAANGCHCSGSTAGAHAAGASGGGCGLVLGQPVRNVGRVLIGTAKFFQEHKPVRKLVGRIAYRVTHPFNGRFRCR